jgi:hypothetical protein
MDTLAQVRPALRDAYGTLPKRDEIKDLAYLRDVDPYGEDALLVYITISDEKTLDPSSQRAIEAALRKALSSAFDYSVYFRWQTEDELVQSRRETANDLIAQPHSALH